MPGVSEGLVFTGRLRRGRVAFLSLIEPEAQNVCKLVDQLHILQIKARLQMRLLARKLLLQGLSQLHVRVIQDT